MLPKGLKSQRIDQIWTDQLNHPLNVLLIMFIYFIKHFTVLISNPDIIYLLYLFMMAHQVRLDVPLMLN